MLFVAAFFVFLQTCQMTSIGLCGPDIEPSPCGHIDVNFDAGRDNAIDFDDYSIHYVTEIEQIYDEDCTGLCANLLPIRIDPFDCTDDIGVVRLWTAEDFPTIDGVPASLAAQFTPGDRYIDFSGTGEEPKYLLRFGGDTDKHFGWVNEAVTLRFHLACTEEIETIGEYSGYLAGSLAEDTTLADGFGAKQTKIGRIPADALTSFIEESEQHDLYLHYAGVWGYSLLDHARAYHVRAGARTLIAEYHNRDDVWRQTSIDWDTHLHIKLSPGDFIQWECTWENTINDDGFVDDYDVTNPIDNSFDTFGCDFAGIVTNSRCGGAHFTIDSDEAMECDDPLFNAAEIEEEEEGDLIYDYNLDDGECGGRWDKHAYKCTDQHTGDVCAFCVGRANGVEIRTCINRMGEACDDIFETAQRMSWCNMEFECPASGVSITLFVTLLAFVSYLLM